MLIGAQFGRHACRQAVQAVVESCEARRLLCVAYDGSGNFLPDLEAAMARNGADHSPEWYAPVGSAGAEGGAEYDVNAAGLPLLTSRSDGQGLKVFLDFDGHGGNLPFSLDGDYTTFNAAEQKAIYDTWRDMVSYFSALDVNITTVQPPIGGPLFAWHLTSNSISGGYAYVGVLSNSQPYGFNQGDHAVTRRSGIAHEIGHLLNLMHQSEYDLYGAKTAEYSDGWDSRHRTVIGIDYNTNIRQWFYGRSSSGASSLQDDYLVMANKVKSVVGGDGFRPDDFGNDIAGAFVLPAGTLRVPAFLERYNDTDVFQFTSTGGRWLIDATPTFESTVEPKLELLDAAGNVLAARDDADQRLNNNNNDVEFSLDLPAGTFYARVSSSGDISEIGEYLLTVSPLPTGFRSQDIGAPFRGGTASHDPATGGWTQMAGGSDIAGTSDEFRYSYNILNGDGSITVRLDSLVNTDASAKAGIMIRQNANTNSQFALLSMTPGGTVQFITRNSAGASAAVRASTTGTFGSVWLRLTRAGSSFTAATSNNGTTFTPVGSPVTVTMSGPVFMGLATVSRATRYATTATFGELVLTGSLGTAPPTYNALPAPTGVSATPAPGANTSIVLNWADISGETGYLIERSADGVNFSTLANVPANSTTYTDTPWGSMRWFYRISASAGGLNSVPSAVVSTVNKPNAPANPHSSYARPFITPSSSQIFLNWADVQGDQGYRVERSTDGVNFTLVTTTSRNYNALNQSGLATGTYTYRITPVTSIGDGIAPSLLINAGTRLDVVTGLTLTSRQSTALSLSWNDVAGETNYRVDRSTDGTTFSPVATLPANTTAWTDTAVTPLNKYYYRVYATNSALQSPDGQVIFTSTPATAPLPDGWQSQDVGGVVGAGAAGVNGSTWTILGSGTDIFFSADQMHFAWRTLTGDGQLVARVTSLDNVNPSTKAGIMLRESLDTGSRYAGIFITPQNGVGAQQRLATNSGTQADGYAPASFAPTWLRLTRIGNQVTVARSANGTTWTDVGLPTTIPMSGAVYIGLAVTATNASQIARATFTDVSRNAAPVVASPPTANPAPVAGTSTVLSVLGDDDGGAGALTYHWSVASLPPGAAAPTFSVNSSNAAASTTATFYATGDYTFRVRISDAGGLSVTADVNVAVVPTVTSVLVGPGATSVDPGGTMSFSAVARDQFNAFIFPVPPVSWSASAGLITPAGVFTAPLRSGPVQINAQIGGVTGSTHTTVRLVQPVPPQFVYDAPAQRLDFVFNGNVSASLSTGDLQLTNLTTGVAVPAGSVAYDSGSDTASFSFPGLPYGALPDGNYRAVLPAGSVSDSFGTPLFADAVLEFFVLAGDANRDRSVNIADFAVLAQNFNQPGIFSAGDFDYSGVVGIGDFAILAGQFNSSLPALRPAGGAGGAFTGGAFSGGVSAGVGSAGAESVSTRALAGMPGPTLGGAVFSLERIDATLAELVL